MATFEKYFPYTYNGKYIFIRDNYDIYNDVNILTDYFNEKPRIESRGHGVEYSPMEYWTKYKYKIIKEIIKNKQDINVINMREIIYILCKPEARMGKISQYFTLLNYFKVKKFLDPSCAWGDRLIAAIAYNCDYLGIDPNADLKEGHDKIIDTFAPCCKEKFKIIYKPFEDVKFNDVKYDFILSSPAPYEGDVYGFTEGQSVERYPEFANWFINYMLATCYNSYNVLEDNGHFLLTILDRLYPKKYAITELLLLAILYKCKYIFYEGVIGWEASKGKIVPFWVFKKDTKREYKDKVNKANDLLKKHYSHIYKFIIQ